MKFTEHKKNNQRNHYLKLRIAGLEYKFDYRLLSGFAFVAYNIFPSVIKEYTSLKLMQVDIDLIRKQLQAA